MRNNDDLSYPLKGITNPGMHDLLLGRGGEVNNHIGNVYFRSLINEYKERYRAASRVDKPKVATEVVARWRSMSPPGRFLTRSNPGQPGYVWEDIGDLAAKKRTSKALGERDYKSKETTRSFRVLDSPSSAPRGAQAIATAETPASNLQSDLQGQASIMRSLQDAPIMRSHPGASNIYMPPIPGFFQDGSSATAAFSHSSLFAASQTHLSESIHSQVPEFSQAQSLNRSNAALETPFRCQPQQPGPTIQIADTSTSSEFVRRQQQQEEEVKFEHGNTALGVAILDPNILPTAATLTRDAFTSSESHSSGEHNQGNAAGKD